MTAPSVLRQRYRLDAVIGQGASGEVYRATDLQGGATVAVKRMVLRGREIPGAVRQRFEKQIQTLIALRHPHLVKTLDGGVDEQGMFLVMDLVAGEALSTLLNRDFRLPWARATSIAVQLCEALGAVHATGIIHQNVKAANVMLTGAGTPQESALLIDYGISRGLHEMVQLSSTGLLLGGAEFSAPEVIRGLNVDLRADVYSFGVLLYRMLTGVLPFQGPELPKMIYQHLHSPPPSATAAFSEIPKPLDAVVTRCLAKDPTERFADAKSLGDALVAMLRDFSPLTAVALRAAPGAAPPTLEAPPPEIANMLSFSDNTAPPLKIEPAPLELATPSKPEAAEAAPVHAPLPPLVPRRKSLAKMVLQAEGQKTLEQRTVALLTVAARLAPLYEENHPSQQRAAKALERVLTELVRGKGVVGLTRRDGKLLLNGEAVTFAEESDELGVPLAAAMERRGLDRVSFEKLPTSADVRLLLQVFRSASPVKLEEFTTIRLTFGAEGQFAFGRAPNSLEAWRRVVMGVEKLAESASRGLAYDTLTALKLADLLAVEATRPGLRLLGVEGSFEGPHAVAAQAANTAFLATAAALDVGFVGAGLRDVAHLALIASVELLYVFPLALTRLEVLSTEERSVLRQSPLAMVRQALEEQAVGPALFRRMVLGYELSMELARGLEEPFAVGPQPEIPPSVGTRLVFAAMMYWGMRAPRSNLAPANGERVRAVMRNELKVRLDTVAVQAIEKATHAAESVKAESVLPGATVAVIGHSQAPSQGAKRLTERTDDGWVAFLSVVEALIRSTLETRERLAVLLFPLVDSLVMQDEMGAVNALIRLLRSRQAAEGEELLEHALARDVVAHLTEDDCLAALRSVLNEGTLRDPREFTRLVAHLPDDQAPVLLRLLDVITNAEAQPVLLDALAGRAKTNPQVFREVAKNSEPNKAADLLNVLARARDPQTMGLLQELWTRSPARGRMKLLETASMMASADALAFITRAVAEPAPQVRHAAIQTLGSTSAAQANAALLALVTEAPFAARPSSDREALLAALAMRAEPAGVAHLVKLISEKPPMLNKGPFNEERRLIISALTRVGGVKSMQLLQTLAQDTRQAPEVKKAAEDGVVRLRGQLTGAKK